MIHPLSRLLQRLTLLANPHRSRETDEQHRLLFDGISDYAIFMLDARGNVSSWSIGAERIFGYRTEEVLGKHFSCFYTSGDVNAGKPDQELHMAAAHGRLEDTGWRVRRDGSQFWANSVIAPLKDRQGRLRGFSKVTRDITEQKKAQEALRQKEEELVQARKLEAIGRLAGGVAHDFNNLVTGIIGLSQEIYQSFGAEDPRRSDLEEIMQAANRAASLTRQLLAFGRRQVYSPRIIDLNTVIQDIERLLRRVVGADVELITHLAPDLGHIQADPAQIEQVLVNLVMNARDAMPTGGRILIETHQSTGPAAGLSSGEIPAATYALLSVTDNGLGMEPEVLNHIFEPFFTTKERGRGTGLGLATVYGIVKQNHGEIQVQSQPGQGTTFQIFLPEVSMLHNANAHRRFSGAHQSGPATVLVAEDEDIVRRVTTRALEKQGYRVLSACSGPDALSVANQVAEPIDLLLTDVVMPGMDGRALAQQLRKTHPETAVLYMSAYPENVIAHRGILEPGMAFIEKSFTSETLARRVRQVLKRHKQAAVTSTPPEVS